MRELDENLWVTEAPLKVFGVADVGARMTIVRLADGGLWVHSPIRLTDARKAALDRLGPVRSVVAPNCFHHMFVRDYFAAYPDARVYAAPGLEKKRKDLPFHGVLGDDAPEDWAGEIDQTVLAGAPLVGEVLFHHKASATAIVTDLVFNFERVDRGGLKWFLTFDGANGGCACTRLLKLTFRDKRAVRATVDEMLGWDFDRLVVSHGKVMETGGREALRAAFAGVG